MELYISNMTESYAKEILNWNYAHPYDFYNNELSQEGLNELVNNQYLAVIDQNDNLIGFYCIGQSAQVPKGNEFGVYEKRMADIGLGVRPDLTGKGFGSEFFKFILGEIQEVTNLSTLRLTVAKFNKRAIRLYENFGFKVEYEFCTERAEFITMICGN
ncbi:GNAT family N-acetyltransferase [Gottfriedia acidiceleris]|uniref:GNAT family N-acetyltransferase n=1 Tax=Gottfriedia acidiceleris TaxID=371036 RepID=A0ABY4JID7_9BACI|nr:GNAT family N-acetyltransferase [Gottfriedia acidiceleris]UPM53593.1 GNAT family N-acetyltransferase [Gottfriedia acidiceleris]